MHYCTNTNVVEVWTEDGMVKISSFSAIGGTESSATITVEADQVDEIIAALTEAKNELLDAATEEAENA